MNNFNFPIADFEKLLNKEQELLLKTILSANEEEKKETWNQWKENYILEDIWDYQTIRLLPAIYKAVEAIEENTFLLKKLKRVYSHNWYKNNSLLSILFEILSYFEKKCIPVIPFKETFNLLMSEDELGTQSASSIHLLVKEQNFTDVCDKLLKDKGYPEIEEKNSSTRIFAVNSHVKIVIHDNLFDNIQISGMWEIWNRAKETCINDVHFFELDHTDHFLYTFLSAHHQWQKSHSWVNELIAINNKANSKIDWGRIIYLVRKRKLKKFMLPAFTIIEKNNYFQLPQFVKNELTLFNFSLSEKIEMAAPLLKWNNPFFRLSRLHLIYCRTNKSNLFTLASILNFLKERSKSETNQEAIVKYLTVGLNLSGKMLRDLFLHNKYLKKALTKFF